ncbi:hypothetical protein CEXT_738861 [Caerostris extrusa]|uniref:Uncharacterized protein n=1 Tax=Caerostris extrusa TaxID=172846 RepID=A0AAV4V498_CAEEX|nr:hypothetical protein CEXT_738861 [Caerostris extrusa]
MCLAEQLAQEEGRVSTEETPDRRVKATENVPISDDRELRLQLRVNKQHHNGLNPCSAIPLCIQAHRDVNEGDLAVIRNPSPNHNARS